MPAAAAAFVSTLLPSRDHHNLVGHWLGLAIQSNRPHGSLGHAFTGALT